LRRLENESLLLILRSLVADLGEGVEILRFARELVRGPGVIGLGIELRR
jgi:hypothetical protein